MNFRWNDYFFITNIDYDDFWKEYLSDKRNILFILGRGFDPRMCSGLERILKELGPSTICCNLIVFDEGVDSPSQKYQSSIRENEDKLCKLMKGVGNIYEKSIKMEDDDGHKIGPNESARIFNDYEEFKEYTDIIVDISSLPLNVYFPLIGKILTILDSNKQKMKKRLINLHVIVTENACFDKQIKKQGLEDNASYLHGFKGKLNRESKSECLSVWIPILGEGQEEQIKRIDELISPNEICPVLPSPSSNPRRGDDIMLEYGEILIERLKVEINNIIYGSEQNPFELYRQIIQTIEQYDKVLKITSTESKFIISPLSSKLMSIGSFLAAYEKNYNYTNEKNYNYTCNQNVGIAYVEAKGYKMEGMKNDQHKKTELFSLWIFGECYNDSNV
jgi:hypothetical protein